MRVRAGVVCGRELEWREEMRDWRGSGGDAVGSGGGDSVLYIGGGFSLVGIGRS